MSIEIRVHNSNEGQFIVLHDAARDNGLSLQVTPVNSPGVLCEFEEVEGPLYGRILTKVFPESLRKLTL